MGTAFGGLSAAAAASLLLLWRAGHCPVPLDLRLGPEGLAARLELVPLPHILVTEDSRPEVERALEAVSGSHPTPELVTVSADPADWAGLVSPTGAGDDDPGLIVFTSGTTGQPKAVLLSRHNILYGAQQVAIAHRLGTTDRVLNALSLAHVNAPVIALLASVLSGGDVILMPRFEPRQFWRLAACEGATWANLVPPLLSLLLRHPGQQECSAMRFLRSASAPLPPVMMAAAEERFGIAVIESYGISEASSQVTANDVPPGRRRPGSVGTPRGLELRIAGPSGESLPAGSSGEILVRGPSVMQGYLGDPRATAEALRDGWLHTGDVGKLSQDGALSVTGRIKELINRGGEKVPPRLVEDVLLSHPAVADAAVIGVPDPIYGEEVKALVVLGEGIDRLPADLPRFVAAQLPLHFRPRLYERVDSIPRNHAGKVWRAALQSR